MRDKRSKSHKQKQIAIRDAECQVRIQFLSTLPDSVLEKLIDRDLF
jgi:hypothetical protein